MCLAKGETFEEDSIRSSLRCSRLGWFLPALLCWSGFCFSEESGNAQAFENGLRSNEDAASNLLSIYRKSGPASGPALSREMVRTFLTDEAWKKEVERLKGQYKEWSKEHDSDMGTYLNDRFLMTALAAGGGNLERIRRAIIWLAFYHEFSQAAPLIASKFLEKYKESVKGVFKAFTWERVAQYVVSKEWRKHLADKTKKEGDQNSTDASPVVSAKGANESRE